MGSIGLADVGILGLVQNVDHLFQDLNGDSGRQALLAGARHLVAGLETPAERITRMSWYEVRTTHAKATSRQEALLIDASPCSQLCRQLSALA